MEGYDKEIAFWGLKHQLIPLPGFKLVLGWFEIWKAMHNTMQAQWNNQDVIHIVPSHADGV
jgi:hypothetical protein